jgi:hypothetical protein
MARTIIYIMKRLVRMRGVPLRPIARGRLLLAALGAVGLAVVGVGCANQTGTSAPASTAPAPAPTDTNYLTDARWNDGQAEVAFYRVNRTRNQYGEPADQTFVVGTYLVKQNYNPEAQTKATASDEPQAPAFKYALFYEFESGSYQYKRNYVTNARQRDLRPYKQSFTSFDWCSNLYRELAIAPGGTVDYTKRSDDYGNAERSFSYRDGAYPPALLPLLVRSLDFSETGTQSFQVLTAEGAYVDATARRVGPDTLDLPAGRTAAEEIRVEYDQAFPSPVGETAATTETYWRGTGGARHLLRMASADGRYRMTLVEELRTPYWRENLWPKLDRIAQRP